MPFLEHPETGVDRSAHEATSSCGGKATKALKSSVHGHLNGHPGRWLVVSPYTEDPHLLDLKAADRAQGLLAKALTRMEPTRNDYATATYSQSFNWTEVMLELKASIAATDSRWIPRTFFIVIFRSQVKATTDRSRLGAFDRSSHAEAMNSGGLLKYWFGVPDKDGRNLATCISPIRPACDE